MIETIKRAVICTDAFQRKLDEIRRILRADLPLDSEMIKSAVFYGVTSVANFPKARELSFNEAQTCFKMADDIVHMIGVLTPDELQEIFPIEKHYDGERGDTVDYFSTMEMIRTLPEGEPIYQVAEPLAFLMDYDNRVIRRFLVQITGWMSDIQSAQGLPTIADAFTDDFGLDALTLYRDNSGKEYLFNAKTGTTFPVEKSKRRRPPWIRVLH